MERGFAASYDRPSQLNVGVSRTPDTYLEKTRAEIELFEIRDHSDGGVDVRLCAKASRRLRGA